MNKKYYLKKFHVYTSHRRTHGPQTYIRRLWLIVLVNLYQSFNVRAWIPLCVAITVFTRSKKYLDRDQDCNLDREIL